MKSAQFQLRQCQQWFNEIGKKCKDARMKLSGHGPGRYDAVYLMANA
jgi:hypothetical protein